MNLPELRKQGIERLQPSYDQNFMNKRKLGAVDGFAFEKLRNYPYGSTDIERKENALKWIVSLSKMAGQAMRETVALRRDRDIDRSVANDLIEVENLKILEEVGWSFSGNFYPEKVARNHPETAFHISVARIGDEEETMSFVADDDDFFYDDDDLVGTIRDDIDDEDGGELVYSVSFGRVPNSKKVAYYSYTYATTLEEAIEFILEEFNTKAKKATYSRILKTNMEVLEERKRKKRGRSARNKVGKEVWSSEREFQHDLARVKKKVQEKLKKDAWNSDSVKETVALIKNSADISTLHDTCRQYLVDLGKMLLKEARDRDVEEKLARRLSDDNQIDLDSVDYSGDDFGISVEENIDYGDEEAFNQSHISIADPMSGQSAKSSRDISAEESIDEIDADAVSSEEDEEEITFDEIINPENQEEEEPSGDDVEIIDAVSSNSTPPADDHDDAVVEDDKKPIVIDHDDDNVVENAALSPEEIRKQIADELKPKRTFVAPSVSIPVSGSITTPTVAGAGIHLGSHDKTNVVDNDEHGEISDAERKKREAERLMSESAKLLEEAKRMEEEARLRYEEEKRLEREEEERLKKEEEERLKREEEERIKREEEERIRREEEARRIEEERIRREQEEIARAEREALARIAQKLREEEERREQIRLAKIAKKEAIEDASSTYKLLVSNDILRSNTDLDIYYGDSSYHGELEQREDSLKSELIEKAIRKNKTGIINSKFSAVDDMIQSSYTGEYVIHSPNNVDYNVSDDISQSFMSRVVELKNERIENLRRREHKSKLNVIFNNNRNQASANFIDNSLSDWNIQNMDNSIAEQSSLQHDILFKIRKNNFNVKQEKEAERRNREYVAGLMESFNDTVVEELESAESEINHTLSEIDLTIDQFNKDILHGQIRDAVPELFEMRRLPIKETP